MLQQVYTANNDVEEKVPAGLLHPNSNFKLLWACFICVIVLYTAIVTPVRIAFLEDEGPSSVTYWVFDAIADVCFLIDIVINFSSAEEIDGGILLTDRKQLALRYLKSWFLVDAISSVPINLVMLLGDISQDGGSYGQLAYTFKFTKLLKGITLYRLLTLSKLVRLTRANKMIEYLLSKI